MSVTLRLQRDEPAPAASDQELDSQACVMARNGWADGQIANYFGWPIERVYVAFRRHLGGQHLEERAT